ncbi:M16 family metallopeptidase [Microlunatus parietis]|uniref:Putative Zn-dependent peptidase n=1 Tax=Microlunatus parietis TaxID=682979 RepID=A0A7Y9IDP4_9ACTN|nr:pitrilysin family protein [Microlunatus parietis]NYE74359.1 putative Zn-dependent peptidase [Microlunatus parietis]
MLPSGLRVVTERMPGSHTFNLGFFAAVGSRWETERLHGASHFLEHVLFKGTKRRTPEQISAEIEAVGGELNAYTAKEHTCFYARVLARDADLAIDVLADMITSSTLRSAEIESERAVILDEIAMHADDPGEVAHELIAGELLAGSGLGKPVIGSPDSIRALRRDQILGYWRRRYTPERLVVSASGRVDHDRLVARLAEYESLTAPREPSGSRSLSLSKSKPESPNAGDPLVITKARRFEQSTVVLARPGPGLFDPDRFPIGLLSIIVGGGMASRLFVEVRERRGLTYGIEAGETSYSDAGLWSVDWQCAPDRVPEILILVRQCLADIAEHGVTPDELARAKGQMRGQTVLSFEGPQSRMSRIGVAELLGDTRSVSDLLADYDAVTGEDVRRIASDLLGRRQVLAVVGPTPGLRALRRALA